MGRLLDGYGPEGALEDSYALLSDKDEPGKSVREVLHPLEDVRHRPSGWTVYTARLALRCLLEARGFRSGVESAVRLAGDAYTNAAVAGALLGARFRLKGIPNG